MLRMEPLVLPRRSIEFTASIKERLGVSLRVALSQVGRNQRSLGGGLELSEDLF